MATFLKQFKGIYAEAVRVKETQVKISLVCLKAAWMQ